MYCILRCYLVLEDYLNNGFNIIHAQKVLFIYLFLLVSNVDIGILELVWLYFLLVIPAIQADVSNIEDAIY